MKLVMLFVELFNQILSDLYIYFYQLISSKAVAEVSYSSCVSLFFSDVDC